MLRSRLAAVSSLSRGSTIALLCAAAFLAILCGTVFLDHDPFGLSRLVVSKKPDCFEKFREHLPTNVAMTVRHVHALKDCHGCRSEPGRTWGPFKARDVDRILVNLPENMLVPHGELRDLVKMEKPSLSCAVVGNAASLLLGEYGPEIDAHDVVFRMNQAPTAGYEKHVGRRTTVRIMHDPRALVQDMFPKFPRFPEDAGPDEILLVRIAPYGRFSAKLKSLRSSSRRKAYDHRLRMASLELEQAAHEILWSGTKEKAIPSVSHRVSAGFLSVVVALSGCDHVDLYGFNPGDYTVLDRSHRSTGRYFDASDQRYFSPHDFDREGLVLSTLLRKYPEHITLRTRNV